jgi:hypothetical protein
MSGACRDNAGQRGGGGNARCESEFRSLPFFEIGRMLSGIVHTVGD